MLVFFLNHKTAYEMRISDWSSDVCSSDLDEEAPDPHRDAEQTIVEGRGRRQPGEGRAIVSHARGEGIEDLRETMRPLVERPREASRQHRGDGGEAEDDQRQHGNCEQDRKSTRLNSSH